MTSTTAGRAAERSATRSAARRGHKRAGAQYPLWFLVPGTILFLVLFAVPTFASFYFSLTRWTLFDSEFIGFENFVTFFKEPMLVQGFTNTFAYALITSVGKVVIGLGLAMFLTSGIIARGYLRAVVFFPVLVSTIGVGITFKVLLNPYHGLVNQSLSVFGIAGPGWLTDPHLALVTVAAVDIWKGVGVSTLIFMAGLVAIPRDYYEAATVDGVGAWQAFRFITIPLVRPAMATVILLNVISGLRSFDLIWAMTGGGPGFTSDVIGSVIYKQYQAGFYGLSTAGNVVLFLVVAAITVPMQIFFKRREINQ